MALRVLFLVLFSSTLTQSFESRACNVSTRYRTLDGSCNNLQHPHWGIPNIPYARLLPPEYADGVRMPRLTRNGTELPNARKLSLTLFGEKEVHSAEYTLVNMQFGQIVAHDMGLTAGVNDPVDCCVLGQNAASPHKRCMAIEVPSEDPVYGASGIHCLNLIRTLTDHDLNGNSHPAQQINEVNSFLDLSLVYGHAEEQHQQLREFTGGRLKVETRDGSEWPPHHPRADEVCPGANSPKRHCYLTGDDRANQSPHLIILQITFVREHNRIAAQLQNLNPHWSDETLFEESRRINVAQYQRIVYYEWLPNFLGVTEMLQHGLIYPDPITHVDDFDPSVDPAVLNSFSTVALRYFHTEIMGHLDLLDESRCTRATVSINDHINNPSILEDTDGYVNLTRGMSSQAMREIDRNFDPQVKHFLFRSDKHIGTDLRSIDIQRARDHGIASYNRFREYCHRSWAESWEDFADMMENADIELLAQTYDSVDDVDLSVAAFFERKLEGTRTGPTVHCILIEQFLRSRRGDRFFFQSADPEVQFTEAQLQQLANATMAKVLCDTTQGLTNMQPQAFRRPSPSNSWRLCESLPGVDLSHWKE